ncbi:MAG TPA: histidine kinase [Balneola sp.]|jgi:K+-sensing histidine kinase KdpD|nr:histidine kinase [Balneola sp.]MBF64159.1 histidine kinase [Balneola sp.]HBZ40194.1 histidine kinase [Balneola sp.]|tara:strand:- start:1924 stop:3150 length:1227 start_codon:yes stop_codon:yes gene_type:complete
MTNITNEKKELDRLTTLADYDIDYSREFEDLDDLSKLAAHISGTPISLINLIGANTQWSISEFGMDQNQISRNDSICDYTIHEKDYLELSDLDKSEDFKDKPYVAGDPSLKYYFGVPLKTKDGISIGAVCVMDKKNHSFSPEKIEMLKIIAEEVMRRLEHRKLVKDLKEKLEEADDVSRKVSHDIRGPIGGIIGLSQIIKDNAEEQSISDIIELIEMIHKGGKSVLDLADEILSTHRELEKQSDYKRESLTLAILKEKLIDLYKPQAQLKDINFKVVVELEHKELLFPKNKILQIFGNMISNAIKFTERDGSVEIHLSFEQVTEAKAKLAFSVKDSGVGMTAEQIDLMMNHQAQSTPGTDNERGFGFGFQLSKHLITSMNGTLTIVSEIGKGSEINVKIPVKLYQLKD